MSASRSLDPTDGSKVKSRTNKRYTPAGRRTSSLAFFTTSTTLVHLSVFSFVRSPSLLPLLFYDTTPPT